VTLKSPQWRSGTAGRVAPDRNPGQQCGGTAPPFVDELAVRGTGCPHRAERTRFPRDPDRTGPRPAWAQPSADPARIHARRARDGEPARGDSRPVREAPAPPVLRRDWWNAYASYALSRHASATCAAWPDFLAEVVVNEGMEVEARGGRCESAWSTQTLSPRRQGPAMTPSSRRALPGVGRFTVRAYVTYEPVPDHRRRDTCAARSVPRRMVWAETFPADPTSERGAHRCPPHQIRRTCGHSYGGHRGAEERSPGCLGGPTRRLLVRRPVLTQTAPPGRPASEGPGGSETGPRSGPPRRVRPRGRRRRGGRAAPPAGCCGSR